jgi:general secretion pathway protein K
MRQMSRARLRMMIEKKLGGAQEADQRQIDQLMDAWNDWLDLNDGPSPNGAEKDYYLSLPVPYAPRNGPIESVEEILSIRGFAEVFSDVNLEAAFTIYGEDELINLNVATIEAMRLIPGLDDELIADILEYRQEKDFQGNGDVAQLIPAENMTDVRQWLNSRKETRYYTIMVYPRPTTPGDDEAGAADNEADDAAEEDRTTINDPLQAAYAETVYVPGFTERPQIMKINPYQKLPLTALPPESDEESGR